MISQECSLGNLRACAAAAARQRSAHPTLALLSDRCSHSITPCRLIPWRIKPTRNTHSMFLRRWAETPAKAWLTPARAWLSPARLVPPGEDRRVVELQVRPPVHGCLSVACGSTGAHRRSAATWSHRKQPAARTPTLSWVPKAKTRCTGRKNSAEQGETGRGVGNRVSFSPCCHAKSWYQGVKLPA